MRAVCCLGTDSVCRCRAGAACHPRRPFPPFAAQDLPWAPGHSWRQRLPVTAGLCPAPQDRTGSLDVSLVSVCASSCERIRDVSPSLQRRLILRKLM